MSASYSVFTSPNHAPIPNHLPTLIVTPHGQPHHTLYSYIHTNFNKETYLLTPSPQGDLCVAKMVPPPGSRGPGGPGTGASDPGHSSDATRDRSVRCEASRNLKWSITNTGINAPVYKLTLPNPDAPGSEQPLFQISKPNPNAPYWTLFYFTYAGHLIPPKRIEFGKIQKNAAQGSGGGGGTRVTITGKSPEEKAVWQTLGEGNEDMVEWIVLCAALNVLDEEIIKAAEKSMVRGQGSGGSAPTIHAPRTGINAVPSSRPSAVGNGPAPPGRPMGPSVSPRPPPAGMSRPMAGPGGHSSPPAGYRPGPAPGPGPGAYGGPPAGGGAVPPPRSYSNPRAGAGPADPRGFPQQQSTAYGRPPQQQQHMGFARPPPQGQSAPGGSYPRPMPSQQQQQQGYGQPPQGYPQQGGPPRGAPNVGFSRPPPPTGYAGGPQGQPVRRF